MKINNIPLNIHDLVSLAEKWGHVADTTRHAVAESATDSELKELSDALRGRYKEIENWLYSFAQDEQLTDEAVAFQSLVVFELEECGGPGLRGLLQYFVENTQEKPSIENLKRLEEAYRLTQDMVIKVASIRFGAKICVPQRNYLVISKL